MQLGSVSHFDASTGVSKLPVYYWATRDVSSGGAFRRRVGLVPIGVPLGTHTLGRVRAVYSSVGLCLCVAAVLVGVALLAPCPVFARALLRAPPSHP